MDAAEKLMTVEEFYHWGLQDEYENKHLELVRGRPVIQPLPDRRHGFVCGRLGSLLCEYVRSVRTGYVCLGAGFIAGRNPDSVYGPDIAWFRKNLPFKDIPNTWDDKPPFFVAEVLAHEESLDYLLMKTADYLRIGVAEVWIAEPEARTITVHRPGQAPVTRSMADEVVSPEVLPGFRCSVADVYSLAAERLRFEPRRGGVV
jgi:Uma2 family endonuclease